MSYCSFCDVRVNMRGGEIYEEDESLHVADKCRVRLKAQIEELLARVPRPARDWEDDVSASGPRFRARLAYGDAFVYSVGVWMVNVVIRGEAASVVGRAPSLELAKERAIAAYRGLVEAHLLTVGGA